MSNTEQNYGGIFRTVVQSGLAAIVVCATLMPAHAGDLSANPQATPTFTVLHHFQGGTDGKEPTAGLVADASGNLYGTTSSGGGVCAGGNCGVVFKISPTGQETVLHAFTGNRDGAQPYGGLIRDSNGNLYGTTDLGGGCVVFLDGCGTVFKVSASGKETVLYRFQGGADGSFPFAGLVRDPAGNLYGTTIGGGAFALGTVFEVTSAGKLVTLYSFTGNLDGGAPACALLRDPVGNLYGTTTQGGTQMAGIVFQLSASGQMKVLHNFRADGTDGEFSWAGLVRNKSGNFYGTTNQGGVFSLGSVFEVSPTGKEKLLYSFSGFTDGGNPLSTLTLDSSGNLYGTAQDSSDGSGTVFELDPAGNETVLYGFSPTGATDGATPQAGVILDTAGNLYGTTKFGGTYGSGVVFKISLAAH